jgi:hypothetical protein
MPVFVVGKEWHCNRVRLYAETMKWIASEDAIPFPFQLSPAQGELGILSLGLSSWSLKQACHLHPVK